MKRELALVVGVGRATGQAVCRRWSDRYKLILVARSKEFITALAQELPDAHALPCDVANRDAWGATLRRIRDEFGIPKRILINTEAAAWGTYNTLSLDQLDNSFDVNAISLLQLVQLLFPNEDEIPAGTRITILGPGAKPGCTTGDGGAAARKPRAPWPRFFGVLHQWRHRRTEDARSLHIPADVILHSA
jgi:NADP-dependent 3-hydroxy acid dehydrogenase YdfG